MVKIEIRTDSKVWEFSQEEALELHEELCALFGEDQSLKKEEEE